MKTNQAASAPQVGHSLIQRSHEHKGSFHKVVGGPSLREMSVASQGAQRPGRTSPAGKVLEGFLEEESSNEKSQAKCREKVVYCPLLRVHPPCRGAAMRS